MNRVYKRRGAKIYNTRNKKRTHVVSFCLVILVITLLFITSNSYARYISNGGVDLKASIAKWYIEVNGVNVTSQTTTINDEINLIVTENATQDGAIQAGQKGYFDISIDPKYTEVSLSYRINIDTSNLTFSDFSERLGRDLWWIGFNTDPEGSNRHILKGYKLEDCIKLTRELIDQISRKYG